MRLQGLRRAAMPWMLLLAAVSQLSLVSAADSYDSLVAAIRAANSGGSGEITLSGDIVLTAALPTITGSVTIDGGGRSISWDDAHRIFDVNGGALTLSNVTLTGGNTPDDEDGGAIRARAGAEVSVQQVTFRNNTAYQGGAIAASGAGVQLDVRQSSFIGNSSGAYAAAIFGYGSVVDITSSSFQRNSAQGDGGAIAAHEEARMSISNSSFAGNAANVGGALEVFASTVSLTHVTMMNNTATPVGGGAIHRTAGEISLYNSIVGGAPGGNACANGLTEARGNLSQDGTCSLMETRVDPLVGELTGAPAWYPLLDGSPALDAADTEFCLPVDQVGTSR
ncbi:MAG: hypothetical protein J4G18_12765, partial [Anaerolineae bacterium]|nr:hypothetical protein [Anaerolineae bacterium]